MSKFPTHDEQGRPIVAELGRAETPEETAARKAAATARHRGNRSVFSLIFALLASFGIVAFLVLVVVRPDAGPTQQPVDYLAAAADAQPAVDEPLVAPIVPAEWYANRARLATETADGVIRWELGFVTAETQYLAITQGIDANPSWIADQVLDAPAGPSVRLGGLDWTSYDRRDVDDPGNVEFALVTEIDGSTIVVSGTAADTEFAILAQAIGKEVLP
ncbi:DUF4245 domain-containing protein [uncultured Schumannella sp.]|uniref:DUF4245 domain-containing protein n=1 Tax=uncultured Schumannella sp. TaxID=1195956 RepID=UPI0025FA4A73|nr:DUF4245 domain-containing protein [uncultured Schumannella sp.]